MIFKTFRELKIGEIVGSHTPGWTGALDLKGNRHKNVCVKIIREATREEFLNQFGDEEIFPETLSLCYDENCKFYECLMD